ncbi:uncharacterized protein LOC110696351 [Chenopodium quinoa]|uniref:uncharacterized protein LOC110696351 n=1 Tax=Chenopodium quinoa TaxID=63459 RepID=UPI000B790D49|nr:uncharacterized protein LOC110696351 [Chenopodium quinoa]
MGYHISTTRKNYNWLYKTKYNPDGLVERLKSSCYFKQWHAIQMDVTNAFLHGDLMENVYMTLPQGYSGIGSKFSKIMITGSQSNLILLCLFIKVTSTSITVVLVYVDDLLICDNNIDDIDSLKSLLSQAFHIKDLREGDPLPDPSSYQRLVGKLIYLTITRPDIAYTIQTQFMQQPYTSHMQAAKLTGWFPYDKKVHFWLLHLSWFFSYFLENQETICNCSFLEAEYRSMALTTCEFSWLSNLLSDLGIHNLPPTVLS